MFKRVTHIVAAILFAALAVYAQEKKVQVFNSNEAQMLPEIKGIAVVEEGKVVLGTVPSKDQRDSEYKDLNLEQGDEILFVNGKKIKTMEDLKKYYGELKTGSEVKFAVQRGRDRFIVEFKKAEQPKGGGKIVNFTFDGKKGSNGGNVKIENGKVIIGGKKMDLDSLKKSGKVIIKQK